MNIPQEEFFVEKLLQLVLFVVFVWFIMAIIHTPKKILGRISIGRYKCSNCGSTYKENYSFWEHLKTLLFDSFNDFFQILRYHNVSYNGISI